MADTDAAEVSCFAADEAMRMNLAFDHHKILNDALKKYPNLEENNRNKLK